MLRPPCMTEPGWIEEQGAKEDQVEKIDAIVGDEVLGYEGSAHAELSGTPEPQPSSDGLEDRLANNRPEDLK